MIDMANHAHSTRTSAQLRAGWKGVALVATRAVDMGAALTLHYGHRPLSEWVKQYAFVPEYGRGGRARFRLPPPLLPADVASSQQATPAGADGRDGEQCQGSCALALRGACLLDVDAGEGEGRSDISSGNGEIVEWRLSTARDGASERGGAVTVHLVHTSRAASRTDSIDSDLTVTAELVSRAERLLAAFDDDLDNEARKCADLAAQLAER